MALKDNVAEIIRIGRLIRELVRSKPVLTLSDIGEFRRLKDERRGHVRAIQNYRPQGATL